MFEENKEVKQQLEEVTSKAESLQSELLESNKTNILLKKKLDDYDLANKQFQESLNKKAAQIKEQTEIEKLVKQLQVMRVEMDVQRAEAIQLIQAVDGQQYGKLEKCLHALLTHAEHWDIEQYKGTQFSTLNEETSRLDSQPYITPLPIILKKIRTGHRNVHVFHGPSMKKTFPLERITEMKKNKQNPSNFQFINLLITFLAYKHFVFLTIT